MPHVLHPGYRLRFSTQEHLSQPKTALRLRGLIIRRTNHVYPRTCLFRIGEGKLERGQRVHLAPKCDLIVISWDHHDWPRPSR